MKRLIDIVISSSVLLLFLPLGIIITSILCLTGEREVFYFQIRVGKNRKCFGLMKYATMLKNSPNMGTRTVTVKNDPRVLPIGRFLRKTKLNEVPQLLNVLKSDMSIIGPRPLTRQAFRYYPQEIQEQITQVKPGLTGIGSIVFRDEESLIAKSNMHPLEYYKNVIAPYKGELEMWYIRHHGLWLDIKLMLLTALVIIAPQTTWHLKMLKGLPENPFD